jgi:long-chain acyl-CoA synthetase
MSSLLEILSDRYRDPAKPFLISPDGNLSLQDIQESSIHDLSRIEPGDIVCLIGDFDPKTIRLFLELVDLKAIIAPLTAETEVQHEYFIDILDPVAIISADRATWHQRKRPRSDLVDALIQTGDPGLVLFSSGTTGPPKAILHNFTTFLERYKTPREALRTLGFLLFDHIGGLNTFFHTLFNAGLVVTPQSRDVATVMRTCEEHRLELLPTTPTFLRMLLMSDFVEDRFPPTLRLITYGTERMDQPTLSALATSLPSVEFRQTYGMSELGILRVKSRSKESLWISVGGEGVEKQVRDGILFLRSGSRMLGYLNAPDPFDEQGWYHTGDLCEQDGEWIKIEGRSTSLVNVGGLKFSLMEVEDVAMAFPGVKLVKAVSKPNPITGEHVELHFQCTEPGIVETESLRLYMRNNLEKHKVPTRMIEQDIAVSARFKKI